MKTAPILRITASTLIFLLSSLAVLPAPTHFLWMVAILVTECGHFLALICLGAAIPLWSNTSSGRISVALCFLAAVLFLTPVIRSAKASKDVHGQLSKAFGESVVVANPQTTPVETQTLTYASGLTLDFYRAKTTQPAALIVAIHGGSWNSGDNKDFITIDRYLASRGFAVADVLYRLAPQSRFPAASDDVRSAIAFLAERASSLNIDPNRIVLLGRSAGGQIALDVAYNTNDSRIRGVISFYAPADLNWSWEHPGNPLVIDTRAVLKDYLGGSPSELPSVYVAASPVHFVTPNVPPTLVFHGGRDELVSPHHADLLDQSLARAGVPHVSIALPWATHGFDYFFNGPGGRLSTHAIDYFLAYVFSHSRQ